MPDQEPPPLGPDERSHLSGIPRRKVLQGGLAAGAAAIIGRTPILGRPRAGQSHLWGRLRHPDSLAFPDRMPGSDTMDQIEHIVVLMMENHSYDNILGMLGRGPGQRPRGDGFRIGPNGLPLATNPYPNGMRQHAFNMPTTCQLGDSPSQEWRASHVAFNDGRNDGFVRAPISPTIPEPVGGVAMGYWTWQELPFTYSLASTFPVGDRWFCSLLGQTDPNRRYLIAATSSGMTDDISTTATFGNLEQDSLLATLANGTIFDRLEAFGISWADYYSSFPTGCTALLYPVDDSGVAFSIHGGSSAGPSSSPRAPDPSSLENFKPIDQFFTDAAAGSLPNFCIVDPNYSTQSQENPQNMVIGEQFMAKVINAVMEGPGWEKTLLIYTYDEHGGYYDHVPPPPALAPDAIPPIVQPGESPYNGFHQYGFRVPAVVVSPYSRPDHVTHVLHDHTSILAMVERKWNLPAMTMRDANATDLMDFIDLSKMAFREPPKLAAPNTSPAAMACTKTGPGTIPPPGSVSSAPSQQH